MSNIPDDWHLYWRTCENGHQYHASENYCDKCPDTEEKEEDEHN